MAVGARAITVPVKGSGSADVLSVNSRDEYVRFRARLSPGCRVLLMGAGLIGCEFANDLAAASFSVKVVDLAPWPLSKLLPETCGRALQFGLQESGVTFCFGKTVSQLERVSDCLLATLSDGQRLKVDVVLSAVGLRPNIALPKSGGVECAQGIVVDNCLQTSAADVYALGNCIEIQGRCLPFILPIFYGARALAQTLAGKRTPAFFPAMPVTVKTPACPTIVCPPSAPRGDWRVSGASPDLEAVFQGASGIAVGFALTGAATARRGTLTAKMPSVQAAAPIR